MALLICIAIYMISWDQNLTVSLTAYKLNHNGIFSSDRYRYGDLYGMSYLSKFRKRYQPDSMIRYTNCGKGDKTNLYVICDSYIWAFFDSDKYYCGVNKLKYYETNREDIVGSALDTTKTNVLLLEFAERNVRRLLTDTSYTNNIIKVQTGTSPGGISPLAGKQPEKNVAASLLHYAQKIKFLFFSFPFNRKINSNLESNIWDISLFTPIKEFKANLNYRWFNTVNQDVKLSATGKHLYYTPTIDTTDIMSSFRYLPDWEKDTMVNRLNSIYDRAKQIGFKKIYLSIIPNPVSILDPHYQGLTYNNLLNRIQNDPKLTIPLINIWPDFKQLNHRVYPPSDTHWNRRGAYIWLDKFNRELSKAAAENTGK